MKSLHVVFSIFNVAQGFGSFLRVFSKVSNFSSVNVSTLLDFANTTVLGFPTVKSPSVFGRF